jgi:hypothetical protein
MRGAITIRRCCLDFSFALAKSLVIWVMVHQNALPFPHDVPRGQQAVRLPRMGICQPPTHLEGEPNVLDSSSEVFHLEEELAVVQVCAIIGIFADRQISDVAIQQVQLVIVVVVIIVVAVLLISVPLERILAPPPVTQAVLLVITLPWLVFDPAHDLLLQRHVAIRGPAPPAKDLPLWMIPAAVEGQH